MEDTYQDLIQAVRDFRGGASKRQDAYTEGSPNEQFFAGKVDGYDDIISFLEYRFMETKRQEAIRNS